MIRGFAALLACQLVGEVVARGLGLPVPGPVLGLVLVVLALHLVHRRHPGDPSAWERTDVVRVSDGLLGGLALLFVPAGVGVVQYLGLLRQQALALGAALVVSTVLTLLVTVLVFVGVNRLMGGGGEDSA